MDEQARRDAYLEKHWPTVAAERETADLPPEPPGGDDMLPIYSAIFGGAVGVLLAVLLALCIGPKTATILIPPVLLGATTAGLSIGRILYSQQERRRDEWLQAKARRHFEEHLRWINELEKHWPGLTAYDMPTRSDPF